MIVFVADAFVEHYVGGAELTTEALADASLVPTYKILSSALTLNQIEQTNKNFFWIFANFSNVSNEALMFAIKNLNYSVLEYDYKYCKYRLPEKHVKAEGKCDCINTKRGKLVSLFLHHAKTTWWMSEKQRDLYQETFPFLQDDKHKVLSSVFDSRTINLIESYDTSNKENKWIILNSKSWVKGTEASIQYAKENNLNYELVWGLNYRDLLAKLAKSKGLISLPHGGDTCPRLVVEAKLLDCELVLNDNVQHKDEEWFQNKDTILEYLKSRTRTFWKGIEENLIDFPKVSYKEKNNNFKIIVPFYNAEVWLSKCIESIKVQEYSNYECYLVDDMSTDNSYKIISDATDDDERFHIIKNSEKKYALNNISDAIKLANCDKNDIIILLDGDDWFSSSSVLSKLNEIYDKENCYMTYGSYIYFPHGIRGVEPSEYPAEIIKNNNYRKDIWRASHLRTFKHFIWEKIDKADLKDDEGDFYKMAYDQAIMLPLLEMSGEKAKYVSDILHVYNKANPLNVDKLKAEEQAQTAQEIRKKEKYKRLDL